MNKQILADYYEEKYLIKKAQRLRKNKVLIVLFFEYNKSDYFMKLGGAGWGYTARIRKEYGYAYGYWHSDFSNVYYSLNKVGKGDGMFPYGNHSFYNYK